MKTEDIEDLYRAAQERVYVRCDDYHPHTAREGCIVPKAGIGNEQDVVICKLAEELLEMRSTLSVLLEKYS